MEWIFWIVFIIIPLAVVAWVVWVVVDPKVRQNRSRLVAERERNARAQVKRDDVTLEE